MPEEAIASAAWWMVASLTLQPKLFQLFQPRGGVSAGLPGAATAAGAATDNESAAAVAASRCRTRWRVRAGIVAPFLGWGGERRPTSEVATRGQLLALTFIRGKWANSAFESGSDGGRASSRRPAGRRLI